jgi:hypothetical protein
VFGKANLALGFYLSLNEEVVMGMHISGVSGLCDQRPWSAIVSLLEELG